MNPQKSGHFFCDHCDDLAFGRFCQTCQQPARWVVHKVDPVAAETAADYFRQMREAVNATPLSRN